MGEVAVTARQIKLMKHMTGFEWDKVKRGKYEAYRNIYGAGLAMEEFESLIPLGLVAKGISQGHVYYLLTKEGLELFGQFMGVKIARRD